MNIGDFLNAIILKDRCIVCSKKYNLQYSICNACISQLIYIGQHICKKCGSKKNSIRCEYCKNNNYYFDYARSVVYYNDIASIIVKKFKYQGMKNLGEFMSNIMYNYIVKDEELQDIEALTYIPFNYIKRYNRYYNHSKILCETISELTGIKVLHSIIKPNTVFISQAKLPLFLRKKRNILFKYGNKELKEKSILIIDDVFTTGKTLSDASRVIKNNNKHIKIKALTFARG